MAKTTTESPKQDDTKTGVDAPKRDMPDAKKAKKATVTWTSNPNVADPTPEPEGDK